MTCTLLCGTDFDYWAIGLAALICAAGSWIAIRVFARARASEGASRTGWLLLAAVPAGATVWTTHFLGLVAFQRDLPASFEPAMLMLSLFIAIVTAIGGFALATSRRLKIAAEAGGAIVGLGIGAMHYAGMSAFRVAGRMEWDTTLVALSLAVELAMGAVALNRVIRPITCYCKYGAASALALAIVGMHVIGWGAVHIVPDPSIVLPAAVMPSEWLGISVASVGLLVIGTGLSSYLLDNRSRAEAEDRMRHLTRHDMLTGLPNRASLVERLDLNLALARQTRSQLAVLRMNLSRFKEINDLFGHHAGDRVLVEITRRMGEVLRKGEFLARVGGDEFAVIQAADGQPEAPSRLAERLARTFDEGFVVGARPLPVVVSIGIAVSPDHGEDRERLLANAEIALDRARESGRGSICTFAQEMDETTRRRRALAHDLAFAVERQELEMFYQVQASVATGEVCGFEALMRWRHPVHGLVRPDEFIPLAEESGHIVRLGAFALERACRDAAQWPAPLKVAVNLSPLQLAEDDLAQLVQTTLLHSGLSPARLELEITESTLMRNVDRAVHVLRRLKALGVSIAMDDFGVGYSSLSTLQVFPFDKIKLDKSFLGEGSGRRQRQAIVRAVISLGRSLSTKVLAEGVETAEHVAFLRAEGCDEAQGYLLGKPAPLAAIESVVRDPTAVALAVTGHDAHDMRLAS